MEPEGWYQWQKNPSIFQNWTSIFLSLPFYLLSCGLQRRLQPEQAADRRERPHALQEVPQQRQALRGWQDRPGCLHVHALHPLVVGLERHGCQPGWHRPCGDGTVGICPRDRDGKYGDHGNTVGALPLARQRGTAVVSWVTYTEEIRGTAIDFHH